MVWFTIALQTLKQLVGAVYRQPDANNDILEYLDTESYPKMSEFGAQSLMLICDFKVHHQEWLGNRVTDSAGRRALQLANCLDLQQIVTEPTREDQILDLVLTDLSATATTYAEVGTSDHRPMLVKLDVAVYRDKPYRRMVWSYDKANFWDMRGHQPHRSSFIN